MWHQLKRVNMFIPRHFTIVIKRHQITHRLLDTSPNIETATAIPILQPLTDFKFGQRGFDLGDTVTADAIEG